MIGVGTTAGSSCETVKEEWSHLSEEEKGLLLPHLLNGMPQWEMRATNPDFLMMWFEDAFLKAQVPFPSR